MRLATAFRPLAALSALAVVVSLPRPARAVEGFTIGLEGQAGSWSVDASKISAGSNGQVSLEAAQGFAGPLDGQNRMGPNLHLGWNVLGHAAIEFAFQTAMWNAFDADRRGGVGMVGGRLTWYPLQLAQHWVPTFAGRPYDLGLEFGYGYAIAGGNTVSGGQAFGMDGTYASFGVGVEYYVAKFVSFAIDWRYFAPGWSKFYFDFNHNVTAPVSGFSAGWNTIGIGVNFHLAAPG